MATPSANKWRTALTGSLDKLGVQTATGARQESPRKDFHPGSPLCLFFPGSPWTDDYYPIVVLSEFVAVRRQTSPYAWDKIQLDRPKRALSSKKNFNSSPRLWTTERELRSRRLPNAMASSVTLGESLALRQCRIQRPSASPPSLSASVSSRSCITRPSTIDHVPRASGRN